jgi:micrococcal nuclease
MPMRRNFKAILVVAIIAGIALSYQAITGNNPFESIKSEQWTAKDSVQQTVNEIKDIVVSAADDIKQEIQSSTSPQPTNAAVSSDADKAGPYAVVRVVDGDTAIININGTEQRCRFIGIDTPESVHPDESRNKEEGKTASSWTKDLLAGQNVYLEYDLQPTDDYGRQLVYVYLEDGRMVQDELLKAGMAQVMTIQPNSKYATHFYELQEEARQNGVGLWATAFKNN